MLASKKPENSVISDKELAILVDFFKKKSGIGLEEHLKRKCL